MVFTRLDRSLILSPVADCSLRDLINSSDLLEAIRLRHFGCILFALQHIHSQGLVHLDIKPSNILVYKSQSTLKLMLSDFGSTQEIENPTLLEFTRRYVAPEVSSAKKLTTASDIYSLGLTIREVFEAQRRFHPESKKPTKEQWKIIAKMTSSSEQTRPRVEEILEVIPPTFCCRPEAVKEKEIWDVDTMQTNSSITARFGPPDGTETSPLELLEHVAATSPYAGLDDVLEHPPLPFTLATISTTSSELPDALTCSRPSISSPTTDQSIDDEKPWAEIKSTAHGDKDEFNNILPALENPDLANGNLFGQVTEALRSSTPTGSPPDLCADIGTRFHEVTTELACPQCERPCKDARELRYDLYTTACCDHLY
jgi:serine/threonine protein kinase